MPKSGGSKALCFNYTDLQRLELYKFRLINYILMPVFTGWYAEMASPDTTATSRMLLFYTQCQRILRIVADRHEVMSKIDSNWCQAIPKFHAPVQSTIY